MFKLLRIYNKVYGMMDEFNFSTKTQDEEKDFQGTLEMSRGCKRNKWGQQNEEE